VAVAEAVAVAPQRVVACLDCGLSGDRLADTASPVCLEELGRSWRDGDGLCIGPSKLIMESQGCRSHSMGERLNNSARCINLERL
jgi:hypothetical protein